MVRTYVNVHVHVEQDFAPGKVSPAQATAQGKSSTPQTSLAKETNVKAKLFERKVRNFEIFGWNGVASSANF